MPRNLITFVDSPQIHLENILLVMEKVTFGKDLAAKIVGGVKKLLHSLGRDSRRETGQRAERKMVLQRRGCPAALPENEKIVKTSSP